MDTNTQQETIALLKRARARYKGPESLVRNWVHFFENEYHEVVFNGETTLEFARTGKVPARMCTFGGFVLEEKTVSPEVYECASAIMDILSRESNISLFEPSSINTIHNLYDMAIEALSKGEVVA